MDKRVLKSKKIFQEYMKNEKEYIIISEYTGMSKQAIFKHLKCGKEYINTPFNFMKRNQRCSDCNSSSRHRKDKNKEKFEELINSLEDYDLLTEYERNNKHVLIKHVCGHSWKVTPVKFKNKGTRCPYCNGGSVFTQEMFVKKFRNIHKDDYSILGEYKNAETKIEIKHNKCDRVFLAMPINITKSKNPTGCPYCYSSHGEKTIRNILKEMEIDFKEEYSFDDLKYKNKLRFDFYLPKENICIEFQGKQHYEPIDFFGGEKGFHERVKRDNLKREYCKNNDIKLIEVSYKEKNIEDFLKIINKEQQIV